MRREKCELRVLSWNVQRVSVGLSMLVQQISEVEEWDAILLQELSFNDESWSLEELEASFGGHKLVTNAECPWDTAIVIHRRWMGFICWFSSSPHAVWVGVRAEEEFTFCSAHLPSWVSDDCFEQSVEEVLETGRSNASGSIFLGIDANCNIDDSGDQRGVLVRELCAGRDLLPLFQRYWTLAWQSPTGSMWKKKVDFFFTNQSSAKIEIAENLHSRSDHKPLRLSRPHAQGIMLEFERKKKSLAGWSPQTSSQRHELFSALRKHVSLGAWVGEIQHALETVMGDVSAAWDCGTPGPLTETERRFVDARSRLKELTASTMLQGFISLKPWSIVASGIIGPPHGAETEASGERIERESRKRKEAGVVAYSGWKKCEQASSCRSQEF